MKIDTLDNWRFAAIILAGATLYFWMDADSKQSSLDKAHTHLGNIEMEFEDLEADVDAFNDTNWREVVPAVHADVQKIHKLIDTYKEKLELEELDRQMKQHHLDPR